MTGYEQKQDTGTCGPDDVALAATKAMLRDDAVSALLGIELQESRQGYSRLSMKIRSDMLNGFKNMHGGMTFSLADTAFACACNSYNKLSVAQCCDIDFTNPAKEGDVLTAECKESNRRGRSGIYDVKVTNQDGTVIAVFRGRSRMLGQPVDPSFPQL